MGSLFTFLFLRDEPLITIGPQFRLTLILFGIFFTLEAFSQFLILHYIHPIYRIINLIIYTVQLLSQFYTALVNAGIPNKNSYISTGVINTLELGAFYDKSILDKYFVCNNCNILVKMKKQPFHCPDCNICVEGFDHHCMWIGKCIAKNNLRSFWLFIGSSVTFVLYTIFILFVFLIVISI